MSSENLTGQIQNLKVAIGMKLKLVQQRNNPGDSDGAKLSGIVTVDYRDETERNVVPRFQATALKSKVKAKRLKGKVNTPEP